MSNRIKITAKRRAEPDLDLLVQVLLEVLSERRPELLVKDAKPDSAKPPSKEVRRSA